MAHFLKCIALCCIISLWGSQLWAQPNITLVEYYIDHDPGYGKGSPVNITPGSNLDNITQSIVINNLSTGAHLLGLRARDANGSWSLDNKWLFVKDASASAVPNIVQAEYYIDTDSGYGKAKAINITPGTDLANFAQNINTAGLSKGAHTIGIRTKDANGAWSLDNKWLFVKDTFATAIPDIVQAEYYIDTDPGYGHAATIKITPDTGIANYAQNISTTGLSKGAHIVGIRAKDANGAWSLDNKWLFIKDSLPAEIPYLTVVECYIDIDPGYGKAIPVAINPVTGLPDFNLPVNVTDLAAGSHTLGIRSKDASGAWSLDNKFLFNVSTLIPEPAIIVNSVPSKELCAGSVFKMSYHATKINKGNTFTVQLSNATGDFTNPQTIGSLTGNTSSIIICKLPGSLPDGRGYRLRVTGSDPLLTGMAESDSITIHSRPYTSYDTAIFFVCGQGTVNLDSLYYGSLHLYKLDTIDLTHVGAGIYTLISGTDSCNGTLFVSVGPEFATWTGAVNNNWHEPGNWSNGRIPTSKTQVTIPAGKTCIVNTSDAVASSLLIHQGAVFQLTGNYKLTLYPPCN